MADMVSMDTSSTSLGDDYQKLENAVLYWHKTTGYIYDPVRERERVGGGGRERERERWERGGGGRERERRIDETFSYRRNSLLCT